MKARLTAVEAWMIAGLIAQACGTPGVATWVTTVVCFLIAAIRALSKDE